MILGGVSIVGPQKLVGRVRHTTPGELLRISPDSLPDNLVEVGPAPMRRPLNKIGLPYRGSRCTPFVAC